MQHKDFICWFDLVPCFGDIPISTGLRLATLEDKSETQALSYAWGDQKNKQTVKRNNYYQFRPLEHEGSIRLFDLEPGSSDSLISIRLRHATLEDIRDAKALSYVWGDQKNKQTIKCNEQTLDITLNLWEALRHIRCEYSSLVLWVDAICIDQCAPTERNHQVRHMARIYGRVKTVLVWLGLDTYGFGRDAFQFAQKLADQPFEAAAVLQNWKASRYSLGLLAGIYKKEYFERMWTTQETGLASSALFIWGRARIEWNTLYRIFDYFAENMTTKVKDSLLFQPERLTFLYRWNSTRSKTSFLQVLEMTRARKVMDPRDRVFALLSHPSAESIIEADYTLTCSEVYTLLAKAIIERSGSLDILSYVTPQIGNETGVMSETNMASFVPDWRRPIDSVRVLDSKRNFNASRCISSSVPSMSFYRFYRNAHGLYPILEVYGMQVGTVTHRLPIKWAKGDLGCETESRTEYKSLLSAWSRIVQIHDKFLFVHKEIAGESFDSATLSRLRPRFDILSQTLTADILDEKYGGMDMTRHFFATYWRGLCTELGRFDLINLVHLQSENEATSSRHSEVSVFRNAARDVCRERVLFITDTGHVGLGSELLKEGDSCVILKNGKVPYVLRETTQSGRYLFFGEAYVHGVMHGELSSKARSWSRDNLRFERDNPIRRFELT